jgi:hypothetical protein
VYVCLGAVEWVTAYSGDDCVLDLVLRANVTVVADGMTLVVSIGSGAQSTARSLTRGNLTEHGREVSSAMSARVCRVVRTEPAGGAAVSSAHGRA